MRRVLVVISAVLLASCSAPAATPPLPATRSPSLSPASPSPTGPAFAGRVRQLGPAERATMTGVSWREGCPVGLDELRMLELSFWGFDGRPHHGGRLVVHAEFAPQLVGAFEALFEARFPIERMEPVDAYGADDNASMAANNTSAFNCRLRAESSTTWSEHAYGRAIDINPVQNPYVSSSGTAYPPAARAYLDRSDVQPGMLVEGGAAVAAFDAIGWQWGGRWDSPVDYQHVSSTGR
jgi:hypothetical protein